MGKTFYSRNKYQFVSFTTLSQWSKDFKIKDREEEMSGIQFREGKFTTDDPRIIKALEDIAQFRNNILEYDPETEENKHKREPMKEEKSVDQELLDKKKREKKLEEIKGLFNQK